MEIIKIEKENWMTKKVKQNPLVLTFSIITIIIISSLFYQVQLFNIDEFLPANFQYAINKHEYYRLWTSLFIHADLAHLFSNLLMFSPFAYFLMAQFGYFYFPFVGLFLGGIINWLTLLTMPPNTYLIGISGVVYWLGATYLTLSFLLDTRDKKVKRFIKISGIALILFFPEVIKTEVSYMAHFIGFILGVISAFLLYMKNKDLYLSALKYEYKIELDLDEIDKMGNNPLSKTDIN
jgi:rhomboid protease GluP